MLTRGTSRTASVRPHATGRAHQPRPFVFSLLLLLFFSLTMLPLVEAGLSGRPSDHWFDRLARDAVVFADVELRNGDTEPVLVRMASENDPYGAVSLSKDNVSLDPMSTGTFRITVQVPSDAVPGRHQPSVVATAQASAGAAQAAVRFQLSYVVAAADVVDVRYADNGTLWVAFVNGHAEARDVVLRFRGGETATPLDDSLHEARVEPLRTWHLWLPFDRLNYTEGGNPIVFNGTATADDGRVEVFDNTTTLFRRGDAFRVGTAIPAPPAGGGGGTGTGKTTAPVTKDAPTSPSVRQDGAIVYATAETQDVRAGETLVLRSTERSTVQALEVTFQDASRDVRLEVVELTSPPPEAAGLPQGTTAVRAFQIKAYSGGEVLSGSFGEARFRFTVLKEELNTRGIHPSDVVLFHERTDGWRGEPTRRLSDDGDRYVFEATFSSFSNFAIVDRRTVPPEMLPQEQRPLDALARVVMLSMPSVVGPDGAEVVVLTSADLRPVRVALYIDGARTGSLDAPPFRFFITPSHLGPGDHAAHVVAVDEDGQSWSSLPTVFHVEEKTEVVRTSAAEGAPRSTAGFVFLLAIALSTFALYLRGRRRT